MKAKHSGDFRITLHSQNWEVPPLTRLRQLLKVALRSYGFKCTGLEEIHDVPVIERPERQAIIEEG